MEAGEGMGGWVQCPLLTGAEQCQQGWWCPKFHSAWAWLNFCTLFTSSVTSCFILEEEHRKAWYSPINPNLLYAQTKSSIVAYFFPVSSVLHFQLRVWRWHSSRSNLCMTLLLLISLSGVGRCGGRSHGHVIHFLLLAKRWSWTWSHRINCQTH